MKKNMAVKVVDRLFLVVYGARAPSEDEWGDYLKNVEHHGVVSTTQLVVTDGGAPTSAQRRSLDDLFAGRYVPVAVVSGSFPVRAMVTAMSWFNWSIRAFSPGPEGLREALQYLAIPARREALIVRELNKLYRELYEV